MFSSDIQNQADKCCLRGLYWALQPDSSFDSDVEWWRPRTKLKEQLPKVDVQELHRMLLRSFPVRYRCIVASNENTDVSSELVMCTLFFNLLLVQSV